MAAVAVLIATVCLVSVGPAQASLPGANGKIAFERRSGQPLMHEIRTMNPDGSNQVRPLQNAKDPAWSPAGTKIAFSRSGEIWVARANGSDPMRLTTRLNNDTDDELPAWSPDGTKIAFVRSRLNVRSAIWVMDADGRNLRRLTTGHGSPTGLNYSPSWSPDGSKILFSAHNTGTSPGLWVMDADGSNQTALYLSNNGPDNPDWSPDGARIVFKDGNAGIAVMDADGRNIHYVRRGTGSNPAWSPDGTKLTFADDLDPPLSWAYGIWVMAADGSDPTSVSNPTDAFDWGPAWQPRAVTRSPWTIAFPSQPDSTESGVRTVTLTNGTSGDVVVDGVTLTGPDALSFRAPASRDECAGRVVAPGQDCTVGVRFRPDGVGPKIASLGLSHDGPGSPASVALSGTGSPGPWLTTSPPTLKFGHVGVGATTAPKTVTFTNTGSSAMSISEIAVEGANPGDFIDLSETCTTLASLRPDRSCGAQVAFRPNAIGQREARLTITNTAPRNPHQIRLTGSGR